MRARGIRQSEEGKQTERAMSKAVRTQVNFFVTKNDYFSLGDLNGVKEDTAITILGDAHTCWILQETRNLNEHWYKLVSQAYMLNIDQITEFEKGTETQRIAIR